MNKTLLLLLAGIGLYLYSRQQAQASVNYYADDTSTDSSRWMVSSYGDGYSGVINDMIDNVENTVGAVTGLGTRGERNNNPGNIRLSSAQWEGQIPGSDSSFITFATPEYGIRALAKLLNNYMTQGYVTVRAIINRWAPPSENVTTAYVSAVSNDLSVSPDVPLNASFIPALTRAIIHHENGRVIYTTAQIDQGVSMAFA